jgi:hypothetical protein
MALALLEKPKNRMTLNQTVSGGWASWNTVPAKTRI